MEENGSHSSCLEFRKTPMPSKKAANCASISRKKYARFLNNAKNDKCKDIDIIDYSG